jgi:2-amino-4-hydroxy-6-hydroxymethyldihydropteridine diphosphokinase
MSPIAGAVAYIGVGSNLADPVAQVLRAGTSLARIADCELRQQSSLYVSAPLGPRDQPDFINAVIALTTRLTPHVLLAALHAIEQQQGRTPGGSKWGPRVIDLDLLLYGDRRLADPMLTLPHPGIANREFVLRPLREIAPDLTIPGLPGLDELLRQCPPPRAKLLVPQ